MYSLHSHAVVSLSPSLYIHIYICIYTYIFTFWLKAVTWLRPCVVASVSRPAKCVRNHLPQTAQGASPSRVTV